jgi:hypothetical protein
MQRRPPDLQDGDACAEACSKLKTMVAYATRHLRCRKARNLTFNHPLILLSYGELDQYSKGLGTTATRRESTREIGVYVDHHSVRLLTNNV